MMRTGTTDIGGGLPFIGLFSHMSDTMKLDIAAYLVQSVAHQEPDAPILTKEDRKRQLLAMAGSWANDPYASQMEAAIRECREQDTPREYIY